MPHQEQHYNGDFFSIVQPGTGRGLFANDHVAARLVAASFTSNPDLLDHLTARCFAAACIAPFNSSKGRTTD